MAYVLKNSEVDFLLRRGRRYVAIEVKAARRWRSEMAKGLRAITALKGVERRIAVYQGTQTLRPDPGVEVLPVASFIDQVKAGL